MLRSRWAKVVVWVLSLIPIGMLAYRFYDQDLTPNPIEFVTRYTGDWTLRFLVFTLAITPLRKLLGLPDLIKFRRLIGLFAFFYGCLHFTTYIWMDKLLALETEFSLWQSFLRLPQVIVADVYTRPFVTAGFTAWVLMLPLAITSTTGWIRRLGGKRWSKLHKLVYISAIAGVIHYLWLVKSAKERPYFYGALVLLALAIRTVYWAIGKRAKAAAARRPIPAVR